MIKDKSPIVIELEDETVDPANAQPVPEPEFETPKGQAIQTLAVLAQRRPSVLWRIFWSLLLGLIGAYISVAFWDFIRDLGDRNIWLGRGAAVATGGFLLVLGGLVLREFLSLNRLASVEKMRQQALRAIELDSTELARTLFARLQRFYRGRAELRWAMENLAAQSENLVDGEAMIVVAERELMTPLDAAARQEVEAAARQVATVTAIVPLALADVAVALFANLRMVRRIAEIYGGRAGSFGSWRLLKTVLLHLAATGAVAIGDDLISSVMGGGLAAKLSRRFGEGVVNGALTARVGIAAMEVCRPIPFHAMQKPRVSELVKNALAGLFSKSR